MSDFYDAWLRRSADLEDEMRRTPIVARGHDLGWIETQQDSRTATVIGAAAGFETSGTALEKSEIPAGWRTGRHVHGEEAIHILAGPGFSVIDGARYDWKPGTTLHIPYRAEHQHVNTGAATAVYLSAHTMDLDLAVKLGRLEQLEVKRADDGELAERHPTESSQIAADGRRIALHFEDAIDENGRAASRVTRTRRPAQTRARTATPGSGSSWAAARARATRRTDFARRPCRCRTSSRRRRTRAATATPTPRRCSTRSRDGGIRSSTASATTGRPATRCTSRRA